MVHVLRVAQHLKHLRRVRAPGGNIASELLHDQHGSLAPAQGNGLGHLGARIVDRCRDPFDRLVADQIADIGNDPGGAGLDKLVVVKLIEIIGDRGDLLADQHQQRLQRATRGLGGELIELRLLVSGKRRGQSLQRGQIGEFRGGQQRLRLGQLRVAIAVDRRQQLKQVETHVITPSMTFLGSGSRTRISAGEGGIPGPAAGR